MKFIIRRQIFAAFAIALLAITVFSDVSYVSVGRFEENLQEGKIARNFIDDLNAFHDSVMSALDAQRSVLISGDRAKIAILEAANSRLGGEIRALRSAPGAIGRDAELDRIETLAKALLSELEAEAADTKAAQGAVSVVRSSVGMEQLTAAIQQLKGLEFERFVVVDKFASAAACNLEKVVLFGALLVIFLVAIVGFILARNIIRTLSRLEGKAISGLQSEIPSLNLLA